MARTTITTNIIESVVKEVGNIMSTRLSRVCADYDLYKETHDAVLAIPAVQRAIRDGLGPRFNQDTQEEKAQSEASLASIQSQLTQCFQVIENLQNELQMVKLDNGALRLQLQREPQSEPCISENITLVIEDLSGGCEEEEEEQQEVQVQNEEKDEADQEEEEEEEEEEDTVYEEEELSEEEAEQEESLEEEEEEAAEEQLVQPEEEEEEEEEEQEEEVEEPVQPQEEEVEVVEVEIKGKMYFTTNETSGIIYKCLSDGDIGDEIGKFVNGKPVFNKK